MTSGDVNQKIIFNSSMPRSGSTLLQNILAQNPRFYCSPTSGLFNILLAAREVYSRAPFFNAQDNEEMRLAFLGFCEQGMRGFYSAITDKPVCCDKSRAWFGYYDWLRMFHPNPKIIICIRDLRAVLSSMEKLFRKNRHKTDPADNIERMNMVTVRKRLGHWLGTQPVGLTVMRLLEALETGNIRHFHIVRFEDLTTRPQPTLDAIYNYLGEERFKHDFDHVEQKTEEDDSEYPIYGEHTIRPRVAPVAPDYEQVLGRELAAMIKNDNPVFYNAFYPNSEGDRK